MTALLSLGFVASIICVVVGLVEESNNGSGHKAVLWSLCMAAICLGLMLLLSGCASVGELAKAAAHACRDGNCR